MLPTLDPSVGWHAKVFTRAMTLPGSAFCMCVYVNDAEDNRAVMAMLVALRGVGLTANLSFKTDAATHAGLYRKGAQQRTADMPHGVTISRFTAPKVGADGVVYLYLRHLIAAPGGCVAAAAPVSAPPESLMLNAKFRIDNGSGGVHF
jgi:hypothetical protein